MQEVAAGATWRGGTNGTARRLRARCCALALVFAASTGAATGQTTLHLREVCSADTVLTLAGADLARGRALLSLNSSDPRIDGWWIDLDTASPAARLHYRAADRSRTGGSVALGPVLGAASCGSACRQISAWEDGAWHELGPPLSVSERGNLETGYDARGRPWVAVIEIAGEDGSLQIAASRLEAGIWRPQGNRRVDAVGYPALAASPGDGEAVLAGTISFAPDREPRPWLRAVPGDHRRGQALAVGPTAAAWLSAAGDLHLSRDGGRSWSRVQRMRSHDVGGWRIAMRAEVPLHPSRGGLPVAWVPQDPGDGAPTTMDLTRWIPEEGWQDLARLPEDLPRGTSTDFTAQQILVDAAGNWTLVGGCLDTPLGAALEVVSLAATGDARRHVLRLQPGWLGTTP